MPRISDLPSALVGTEADMAPVVQAGQTRKQTRTQLRAAIVSGWQGFIGTFLGAANIAAARTAIGAISSTDNITGSAAKLSTARTVAITGDGSWSVNFDGSGNVSGALTLATSGVAAGTYGAVTVTAKGIVTAASAVTPVVNGGTGLNALGTGVAAWLGSPTSANLAATVTDETGSGALVFGTAPTLSQPLINGVTTNSNAAAGAVGEYISSNIPFGTPVPLASGTPVNITSIVLTPGDWDVSATVGFLPAGTTTTTAVGGGISTTSGTMPVAPAAGGYIGMNYATPAGQGNVLPVGITRFSLATTTTVYLVGQSTFAVSTNSGYGFIRARRVR